jgi:hypothetical protein
MKHLKEIAVMLVLVIAGVAFSQQAMDESKKPATQAAKKPECCSKMKSKGEGKMACCSSDSAGTKEAKTSCGKH